MDMLGTQHFALCREVVLFQGVHFGLSFVGRFVVFRSVPYSKISLYIVHFVLSLSQVLGSRPSFVCWVGCGSL